MRAALESLRSLDGGDGEGADPEREALAFPVPFPLLPQHLEAPFRRTFPSLRQRNESLGLWIALPLAATKSLLQWPCES